MEKKETMSLWDKKGRLALLDCATEGLETITGSNKKYLCRDELLGANVDPELGKRDYIISEEDQQQRVITANLSAH